VFVLLAVALAMALSACETRPPLRPESASAPEAPPTVSAAEQAERTGEFVVAAREFERLAEKAGSPEREHYSLKSVEMLLRAGQPREARERLANVDVSRLDVTFRARKDIHQAQLLALEGKPDEALRLLTRVARTPNLSPSAIAEVHRVRAQAEFAIERPIAAMRSLLAREQVITVPQEITRNQQELWKVLESMTRTQLTQELANSRDPVLTGWLELAIAALENAGSYSRLAIAVDQWRKSHPGHPASPEFLASVAKPRVGQIGRVSKIALLLPLGSDYAQAASAVRDGFVAMNNADRNPEKPVVSVVDTGKDPAGAVQAYEQAVKDGAQLIVGPLGLEAADMVVRQTKLEVPTLLLSHTTDEIDTSVKTVFQFGLPPEQEAIQAAERAWLDGHRQAAVLFPLSSWGRRMQTAFLTAWQRLGGIIVSEQAYQLDQSDYSDPIKHLLNIIQSEARRDRLESLLKMKLEFRPRPREDVNFIFLAADAKHARLIKAHLNYQHASRMPVYASSHVFTGRGNPGLDADLDGVQFPDMPWMLVGDGRVAELRASVQGSWPYAHSGLDRLYALGIDAYAVIPHLNLLSSENAARYAGVTSGLSLGRGGRLHRQLLWARFRKGVPILIDNFLGHKSLFDTEPAPAPKSARPRG